MRTAVLIATIFTTLNISCATGQKNSAPNDTDMNNQLKNGTNIFFENKTINADLNFTSLLQPVVESNGINRCYINSAITFKQCTFKGKLTGYVTDESGKSTMTYFQKSVAFIDCIFEDDVNLRGAIFSAPANFQGCSFVKKADFQESHFYTDAFFNETKYREEAYFQNAVFAKKIIFMNSRFESNVYFQNATFYFDSQFSNAEFQKYADFTVCTFQMGVFFNYCKFQQQAIFNSSVFGKRFEMLKITANKVELRKCYFGFVPKLMQSDFSELLDISGSHFAEGIPVLKDITTKVLLSSEITSCNKNYTSEEFLKASGR
ncbi:MAG TPA: pentapeptide repeat-containing protein [Bacteroidia bacterium]|nr:pentapeptide repeat-containing protein [Bacteroidia bacterium]HRH84099.1 pentapeptide repeat-containing protein [Bacteroidia bacterium]